MKKLFLFLAVMAFGFFCFSQDINLDDVLAEEPQVVQVQLATQPAKVVKPVQVQPAQVAQVQVAPTQSTVVAPGDNGPIKQVTVDYSTLSASERAKFSAFANQAAYGTLIKKDLTGCTITSVTTVKNVPSRSGRKMTQYVVIYITPNGEKCGMVMTENPLVQGGCTPCYIKCFVATPGYHQGDDDEIPQKPKTGENHQISQEW